MKNKNEHDVGEWHRQALHIELVLLSGDPWRGCSILLVLYADAVTVNTSPRTLEDELLPWAFECYCWDDFICER